jgi:hypothetical protein
MKTTMMRILLVLQLGWAGLAHGWLPESGWYWNPLESGRGFNIEVQDGSLFLAAFVYRPDGSPVWYSAGGPMTNDRFWTADLFETSQGQCIGCSYRAPAAARVGTAIISFTSERSAVITILGVAVSATRYDFTGFGTASIDALMGEWSTTEGDPAFPVYFGERITLTTSMTGSSGPFAAGNRTGATNRVAVGLYDTGGGFYSILLDSSTQYYTFYVFFPGAFNRVEGQAWTFLKTAQPSGGGLFFVAQRTKSAVRVRTGVGPGVTKASEPSVDAMLLDEAMALKARSTAGTPDVRFLAAAQRLKAMMPR